MKIDIAILATIMKTNIFQDWLMIFAQFSASLCTESFVERTPRTRRNIFTGLC